MAKAEADHGRPTPARRPGIRPRVFSGVQPTGNLHLGNYLGAVREFVKLQDRHECLYCIVDLHAITTCFRSPKACAQQRHSRTDRRLYRLRARPEEKRSCSTKAKSVGPCRAWLDLFNCVARIGWLNRMTQFKEKAGKNRENASVGLYDYPVLQAADILAYRATHVPIGEDQKQHLELSRDIAQKFNNDFSRARLLPLARAPDSQRRRPE